MIFYLSLCESFPNVSLSLWERSGEGYHIASQSFYAGGVPSPDLPQGEGIVFLPFLKKDGQTLGD